MLDEPINIVTLCTGNAARSVMMAVALATLADAEGRAWRVRSAGTHAAEGAGVSARTLAALDAIDELDVSGLGAHRSHQLDEVDVAWADVILCAEADHVRYVRRVHPEATSRTVSLAQLVRMSSLGGAFRAEVRAVAETAPDESFDVADPAGREQVDYDRCAEEVWGLCQALVVALD